MSPSIHVAPNPTPQSSAAPCPRISVLTVLRNRQERTDLLRLLSHSRWDVHHVQSFGQASVFLRTYTVGVVVAQYQPSGDISWRSLVEETRRLAPAPRLVVTDRNADEFMWAEVLNLGAYDLLAQPFDPQEVFRVLGTAWRSWKYEWDQCREAVGKAKSRPHAA